MATSDIFSTPKSARIVTRRVPGTLFHSPNKTLRSTKGLFQERTWYCNCTPRLPAPVFQVRKPGANKGRWFYTCQLDKLEACGFFLWKDEAVARERDVVLSASSGEKDGAEERERANVGGSGRSGATVTPPTGGPGVLRSRGRGMDRARTLSPSRSPSPTLRKSLKHGAQRPAHAAPNLRGLEIGGEDEFGAWPLSENEEHEMLSSTQTENDHASTKASKPSYMTPQKRKRSIVDDGEGPSLVTPQTMDMRKRLLQAQTPGASDRLKGGMWDGNERFRSTATIFETTPQQEAEATASEHSTSGSRTMPNSDTGLRTPSVTPTPDRPIAPLDPSDRTPSLATTPAPMTTPSTTSAPTPIPTPTLPSTTLRTTLLPLLTPHLPRATLDRVATELRRHELQLAGVARGRDVSRLALRRRDDEIVALRERVLALERRGEVDGLIGAGTRRESRRGRGKEEGMADSGA